MLEIFHQLGINLSEHVELLSQLDLSSLPQDVIEKMTQITEHVNPSANGVSGWDGWICCETLKGK